MTCEWFKIGNNKVDLPLIRKLAELCATPRRLGCGKKAFRYGPPIADTVVDVGETESVNLRDFSTVPQVFESAIERGHVHRVSSCLQMPDYFFSSRRMS